MSFGEFTGAAHESAPRGFRWWRVSPTGELYSAWFDQPWESYANEATCAIPVSRVSRRAWAKRHADGVPAPGCSCGFYALHRVPEQAGEEPDPERPWLLDPEGWSGLGASVVFGVAEAWGRVLIGTEGWRSRFSRSIALFVPQGSDLWDSDRMRLLSERYGVPITASLETLVGEWAPEPIEDAPPVTKRLALPIGLDVRSSAQVIGAPAALRPDRWVPDRPDVSQTASALPGPQSVPDLASRTERQVAAIERLAGEGPKRILELGTGAGYRTSPLGERGHSVVSVAGEFSRIDLPGPFDVVGYFGGFGAGSDDEQRDLLRHIAHWVEPEGCVLIEVLTPWGWVQAAPRQPGAFPKGERAHGWMFDADSCRMQVRAGPLWDEGATDTQALRCYSPADLRLLLENTGLVLDTLEPFASDGYETVPSLEAARLYLARLVRKG